MAVLSRARMAPKVVAHKASYGEGVDVDVAEEFYVVCNVQV